MELNKPNIDVDLSLCKFKLECDGCKDIDLDLISKNIINASKSEIIFKLTRTDNDIPTASNLLKLIELEAAVNLYIELLTSSGDTYSTIKYFDIDLHDVDIFSRLIGPNNSFKTFKVLIDPDKVYFNNIPVN